MKVISLPGKQGKALYRVYGANKLPFDTANSFLLFQENRGRSPNTVRSQAYDVVSYFRFLQQSTKSWLDVGIDDWVNFVHYLKYATKDEILVVLPSTDNNARTTATINRTLSTLNTFYKYHHAKGNVEMPNIHECISNPFGGDQNAFLSFASKSRPKAVKRSITIGKQRTSSPLPQTISTEDQKRIVKLEKRSMCTSRIIG